MPIYEYECPTCGRFEVIQKPSEKALSSCPQCKEKGKKSKVERLVSSAAFHLKGGGWYKTDYSSSSSSKGGSSSSASAKEAPSSTESSSTKSNESGGDVKKASGGCGGSCSCH